MLDQTIAPPVVIPWDTVETLVKAGIPSRQIAAKLGMPDEEERIKRQVSRKGWAQDAPTAILNNATKALETLKSEIVPAVPTASQVLERLGTESKSKGAIALNKGLTHFSEMEAEMIVARAAEFKALVSTGTPLHGWEGKDRPGQSGTVINIALAGLIPEMARAELTLPQDASE